jgi:ribosomal protein L44E
VGREEEVVHRVEEEKEGKGTSMKGKRRKKRRETGSSQVEAINRDPHGVLEDDGDDDDCG